MSYSDEILLRSQQRGLTRSERHELREAYLWEQKEKDSVAHKMQHSVKTFGGKLEKDMPRHRVLHKFPHMQECPICFKIRGYNEAVVKEYNYMQDNPDDFCMKPQLHHDKSFNMMITRERIDLDARTN